MSARIPARRIGQAALSASTRPKPPTLTLTLATPRFLSLKNLFKRTPGAPNYENPVLQDLLLKRRRAQASRRPAQRPDIDQGKLSPETSIFSPDLEIPGIRPGISPQDRQAAIAANEARAAKIAAAKDAELSALKLDPDPRGRTLWERRKVIQSVQRRGRLSKEGRLARTERKSLFRSMDLPTSVKKLTRVMNQISGKTVEEALVQLRFSKKRIARDVIKGLAAARDEAIVSRGMGMGIAAPKQEPVQEAVAESEEPEEQAKLEAERLAKQKAEEERLLSLGTYRKPRAGPATTIELKDGTRKQVHDPTEIYIDQAWVGKGEHWKSYDYRARGNVNLLIHRTTSFSVLLKEEKTRMRISQEIKKKRANRKLWVALPDRPVTTQRQFCMW